MTTDADRYEPSAAAIALGVVIVVSLIVLPVRMQLKRHSLTEFWPAVDEYGDSLVGTGPSDIDCPWPRAYFRLRSIQNRVFDGGNMKCAIFAHARLENVKFEGVHLINADFRGATLVNVTFADGELLSMRMHRARLRDVEFRDVLLGPTPLFGATLDQVTFVRARCRMLDHSEPPASVDPCTVGATEL